MHLALQAIAAVMVACSLSLQALAGTQRAEPLADAVRTALSAAVSEEDVHRAALQRTELVGMRDAWVQRMQPLLERRLRRAAVGQWRQEWGSQGLQRELLETVWYEATRSRLEPELVLGLIEVESDFRKFAVSSAGALGLMLKSCVRDPDFPSFMTVVELFACGLSPYIWLENVRQMRVAAIVRLKPLRHFESRADGRFDR